MAISDHVSPREALRADLKDHFRQLADASIERVDCADMLIPEVDPEGAAIPAWHNVPVLTVRALETILREVFGGRLAPPSERTAEVAVTSKAAALVVVFAECPRCHISQRMPMSVDVQMIQDREGESLKLKPTSKEAAHNCGQLPLPEAEEAGQEKLPLDEGEEDDPEGNHSPEYSGPRLLNAGEAVEGESRPMCANAACSLEADHEGDCVPAEPVTEQSLAADRVAAKRAARAAEKEGPRPGNDLFNKPKGDRPGLYEPVELDGATYRIYSINYPPFGAPATVSVELSTNHQKRTEVSLDSLRFDAAIKAWRVTDVDEDEAEGDLLPGVPTNIRCPRCQRPLPFNVVHERAEDCLKA